MYLRNLIDDNNFSNDISFRIRFLRIFLFVLIIVFALISSSLTEKESESMISKDLIISDNALGY